MFGIDDAILAAVGGSMVSGIFNDAAARDNRRWQKNMSNTSYQRAVADMKAAGLNPMLAYQKGGATTPSGAVAAPIQTGDLGYTSSQEVKLKAEQRALIASQVGQTESNTRLNDALNWKAQQEAAVSSATAQGINLDNQRKLAESPFYDSNASLGNAKLHGEIGIQFKTIDNLIQQIETGNASAASFRAQVDQLKAMTQNLKLDSSEKEAMSQMWEKLGSGGAAAKTFVPFLQLLKSVIGGGR